MNENQETDTRYHSVSIDQERCTGHMRCIRACPTGAIRIRKNKAKIIEDRCIACGECIAACDKKAIRGNTDSFIDFSRFKHTIAMPSQALYAQFLKDIFPAKIQKGLLNLGFSEVLDISNHCEAVSLAIGEFLQSYSGPKPLITTFCPTVVRLIQVKYPELIDNLLPIESPREIAARDIKQERAKQLKLDLNDIGVIYITPCPSKMLEIRDESEYHRSFLDGAISIADIYGPLLQAMSKIDIPDEREDLAMMSSYGLGWSMLGGVARPLRSENWLGVSGIHDTIRILSDIENRKISEVELIECFSCIGGCVGGSLTVDNMYVARAKAIRLVKAADKRKKWELKKIQKLFKEGYFSRARKITARPVKPLGSDIAKAIEKMKAKEFVYSELPKMDCGACGSPNCEIFAEDVVQGRVRITDCHFKRNELIKKKHRNSLKLVE